MTITNTLEPIAHQTSIEDAWRQMREARRAYNALDHEDDEGSDEEEHLWEVVSKSEAFIQSQRASNLREVEIQLWCAMLHAVRRKQDDAAVLDENFDHLAAADEDMEWPARVVLSALRSVRGLAH